MDKGCGVKESDNRTLYLIIIAAVLAFCMPFFVFKIRNQVVDINKKLARVIELLEVQAPGAETSETVPQVERDNKGRKIKICPKCGEKNRAEDWKCIHCGKTIAVTQIWLKFRV